MSEQGNTQASTKRRRSRRTSKQNGTQVITLQRPTNDPEAWEPYWKQQGWPWRTAPEIAEERKKELVIYLGKEPNVEQDIYPFKGVKLSRADVEWLLASYSNRSQYINRKGKRNWIEGLDLRGANLAGEDLSYLPLIHLWGGLYWDNPPFFDSLDKKEYDEAAILMDYVKLEGTQLEDAVLVKAQLKGAILWGINLRGANLNGANLEDADLEKANLEGAQLIRANLERANLNKTRLGGANLSYAKLEGANLEEAQLEDVNLREALLNKVNFQRANLKKANLSHAQLNRADLAEANLERAELIGAQLEDATLGGVQLNQAKLFKANLKRAYLLNAQLEGADLREAQLEGANLIRTRWRGANLEHVTLCEKKQRISPQLADANWNDVDLTVVQWSQMKMLGDEYKAKHMKDRIRRLDAYEKAFRANHQLSVALRGQGLSEEASRLAYRAQKLQRAILWQQRKYGRFLFSLYLWLTSGYGYRLWMSFATYAVVIFGFATTYYFLGPVAKLPLSPLEAIIFSITSFHGRGFSPGENIGLSNPLTIFAAFEAFVGLIVEVTFIATLTQRLFGK